MKINTPDNFLGILGLIAAIIILAVFAFFWIFFPPFENETPQHFEVGCTYDAVHIWLTEPAFIMNEFGTLLHYGELNKIYLTQGDHIVVSKRATPIDKETGETIENYFKFKVPVTCDSVLVDIKNSRVFSSKKELAVRKFFETTVRYGSSPEPECIGSYYGKSIKRCVTIPEYQEKILGERCWIGEVDFDYCAIYSDGSCCSWVDIPEVLRDCAQNGAGRAARENKNFFDGWIYHFDYRNNFVIGPNGLDLLCYLPQCPLPFKFSETTGYCEYQPDPFCRFGKLNEETSLCESEPDFECDLEHGGIFDEETERCLAIADTRGFNAG